MVTCCDENRYNELLNLESTIIHVGYINELNIERNESFGLHQAETNVLREENDKLINLYKMIHREIELIQDNAKDD